MRRPALLLYFSLILTAPAIAEVKLQEGGITLDMDNLPIKTDVDFKATPDFATMVAKTINKPELRRQLEMVLQMRRNDNGTDLMQNRMLGRYQGLRDGVISKPFHYAAADKVEMAQQRARIWGQMLATDLNNDGQITKQEVRETLEFYPTQGAADAFFTSDVNDDNVLSAEEIRTAVEAQTQVTYGNNGRRNPGLIEVFDFDDDGYLTPEEYQRGLVALGYATP